ncbi:MAG: hypothetical protein J6I84_04705 [Bacilli bacterium]|nr:hypothetical protein [Bacilli bacterium]
MVIFYLISESNFWTPSELAFDKISTALIRFKSRFNSDTLQNVGQIIIDSSAKGVLDSTKWFVENSDPKYTWFDSPAHYEVRPQDYKESDGKTFKVFTGSGKYPPQILANDDNPDPSIYDPDKIIKVPIQLLRDYKRALVKSLQDYSGISTGSTDSFFGGNIKHIVESSTIINRIPEIITVDFYDKTDRLLDHIWPMLSLLPYKTPIWLGLDLSYAKGGDKTGIAISTFEGWEIINGTKLPKMAVRLIVAIQNKEGQEISLFHIEQLIMDLHKRFNLTVNADAAYSRQILQACDREGINNNGRISTDIVPCEPALYTKSAINGGQVQLVIHKRFQREAYDLYYTEKGKVDHPKKASISNDFDNPPGNPTPEKGSKDCWDAVCQSLYGIKLSIDAGDEYGMNGGYYKELQVMNKVTDDPRERSREIVQSMMESVFD